MHAGCANQLPRRKGAELSLEAVVGVTIRSASADDASECGRICHDAFASIATRHGFPPDFPSVEVATGLVSGLIAHPGFFGIVAERDGRIVGSNFLDERSMIAGVGPITVDADVQDRQIGRALMNAALQRGWSKGNVRLPARVPPALRSSPPAAR